MRTHSWIRGGAGLAVVVGLGPCALAQFNTGFEAPTYTASAAGTGLSGHDGWRILAGQNDLYAFPYANNPYGIPQNPFGGSQFVAGGGFVGGVGGSTNVTRDVSFAAGGRWSASWDVLVTFSSAGTRPVASTNDGGFYIWSTGRTWNTRHWWTDTGATAWNADYEPFDAAGNHVADPGNLPDPAFGNLLLNHWYRQSVTWSFDTNLVESVSITDLTAAGPTTTVSPSGWYLGGGASSTLAFPTGVRILATGNLGTVTAYDNFSIAPVPGPGLGAGWLAAVSAFAALRRRK